MLFTHPCSAGSQIGHPRPIFQNQRPVAQSMERETGIEPALVAWKATVLPLNYSRPDYFRNRDGALSNYLRRFHPLKAYPKKPGGGRWITPGILPSAPPGPAFGCSKSLQAILSNQNSISVVRIHLNNCPDQNTWWREVDSNHRRHEPADLQSAPVGRLGIPPKFIRLLTLRQSPTRLHEGGGDRAGYCPFPALSLSRRHG